MAETFVTVYQGNGGRIDLGYDYTQDYATNKTSLTVKAYVVKTNASYYSYRNSPQTFTLTVNGVATTYGWTFNFSNMSLNVRYLVTTAVRELTHNSDGTCGNIGASVYCPTGTDGLGTISGSTTIPITTIPRTSIPTLSTTTQAIGSIITIYTNKQAAFTHKISYAFGSESAEISSNAVDSFAWTLPTSLANRIPNATSGVGTITVKTYSGDTYIGERTINFTTTVPDTAAFQPTATSLASTIYGTGRDKTISKYVQNISKATLSFVSNALGGAGVSSSSINIKRQSDSGNSTNISGSSGTSDILTLSGTYLITATTVDTRGRSKITTITIVVEAYVTPKITSFTAARQAVTKTSVDTVRNGTYTYMDGSNPLSVVISRAFRGGAYTALNTTAGTTSGTFTGTYISTGNLDTSSYDFKLVITDSFGNSDTDIRSVSTAAVALCVKGDIGIGVGKLWEQGVLDVGGDMYITGVIRSTKATGAAPFVVASTTMVTNLNADMVDGKDLNEIILAIYPVGAIYMSVVSTSPASLFGGTWVALGGRFLIGADGTYTNGTTGGSATHTLTEAQMPAHAHDSASALVNAAGAGTPAVAASGSSFGFGYGQSYATTTKGSGLSHNNMPPYLSVYMWKRTA